MAPPSHKSQLERYSRELKRSQRWRRDEGYDDLWHRMIDLYRGKQYSQASPDDRLVINMAFSIKNVIAPSVAINTPRFTVGARMPDRAPHAVVAEEALNYIWRANKYQAAFRPAVDDFLIIGHGWMKTGYKFVREEVEQPPIVDAEGELQGVDDREEIPGNLESESKIKSDRPYSERVSPFDMFVDPDARTVAELGWIAQRVKRPLADVRADGRYKAAVRSKVSPSSASRWADESHEPTETVDGPRSTAEGYVDIWEFYDIRRNTYCVFAEAETDGFLIAPQPIPYSKGHPFEMLRNYDIPDFFYPMGELEAIESPQTELNATRTQMLNHRKRYARKYLYKEDAFSEKGMEMLESDEDNALVPVRSGEELERAIKPMPTEITPADFYNQSEIIQGDIDRVTGTSDYMRGNMPNLRRTATEAAMIQDAQNARAADKLARIEQFLGALGERILCLLQQYMTGEQLMRIVGADGLPFWVTYDREYIQGDFDFEIEAGSTQPRNESFRRQAAMQLMDAMAPFIGNGVVNAQAVARHVLTHGFGIKTPEEFLAQPDPMAEQQGPQGLNDPQGPGGPPPQALGSGQQQNASMAPPDATPPPVDAPQFA